MVALAAQRLARKNKTVDSFKPTSALRMNNLWAAMALVLVIEGLMPLIAPAGWRRIFERVFKLSDGQIRFYGLSSIVLGLLLLWLAA
jgi:uncharacterized protein